MDMITDNQIRVINLLPGTGADGLECDISVVSLDSQPEYEALSYVWGSHSSRTVKIGQRQVPATDNLYDALLQLRYANAERRLWTDQLCIDQSNIQEKNHQVGLMRRIYSSCSTCIIWLGEFSSTNPPIAQSIAKDALDFMKFWANLDAGGRLPLDTCAEDLVEKWMVGFGKLVKAFERWWDRIWTLQEIVLPLKASIRWGNLSLDWEVVRKAAMGSLPGFVRSKYYDASNLVAIVRGIEHTKQGEDPMTALQRWRYREATDPRDKIYALMGLYTSSPFCGVQICDYGLETSKLFRYVTLDLISRIDSLAPLIGQRGEPQVTTGLPTWALDFVPHPDPFKRNVRYGNTWHRYGWYYANAKRPLRWSSWNNQSYGPILRLDSLYVDTIKVAGNVLNAYSDRRENLFDPADEEVRRIIDDWEHRVRENLPHPAHDEYPPVKSPEKWTVAFYRTILGDMIFREHPVRRFQMGDIAEVQAFRERGLHNETRPSLQDMVVKRRFFITSMGLFGIGPPTLTPGDEVRIFAGCQVPLLLRPKADERNYKAFTFVGDAYVHGIMYGDFAKANGERWGPVLIH